MRVHTRLHTHTHMLTCQCTGFSLTHARSQRYRVITADVLIRKSIIQNHCLALFVKMFPNFSLFQGLWTFVHFCPFKFYYGTLNMLNQGCTTQNSKWAKKMEWIIRGPYLRCFLNIFNTFNQTNKTKYTKFWAFQAKLKTSAGHFLPGGRMFFIYLCQNIHICICQQCNIIGLERYLVK